MAPPRNSAAPSPNPKNSRISETPRKSSGSLRGVDGAFDRAGKSSAAPGGIRTHDLSLRRAALYPDELVARGTGICRVVAPRVRFEVTRPYGHYVLNVARLPFRQFVIVVTHCLVGQEQLSVDFQAFCQTDAVGGAESGTDPPGRLRQLNLTPLIWSPLLRTSAESSRCASETATSRRRPAPSRGRRGRPGSR